MKDFLILGNKAIRISSIVFLEKQPMGDSTKFAVYLSGIAIPLNLLLKPEEAAQLNYFFDLPGSLDDSIDDPVL